MSLGMTASRPWGYLAAIAGFALISRRLIRRVWKTDGAALNDLLADTGRYYALWALIITALILV
jgi:hypothetical protein